MTPPMVLKASKALALAIGKTRAFKETRVLYSYLSLGNELDTEFLNEEAIKAGKVVAVPVTEANAMRFVSLRPEAPLTKGQFGIREPSGKGRLPTIDRPGLMIVPLVGYQGRYRIGYGKGYYDRYLKTHGGLYTIGVCYTFQRAQGIVFSSADIPLDEIRTFEP